ncbi:hypothetical protein INT45_003855 [Circinella minor]|uniref:Uncharacterized protein n=1 Tax=Circinella minor TaxID=1195481 RepID=A0A8H7SCQ3_9FUNG|nr:hypothetical protein INT45_003855 [Circinella minor]
MGKETFMSHKILLARWGWSLEYLWQNIEKEEETEEIFGCHTTEGESSASKVVKRKNPYIYSPSASIKRQTTSFYENVMERYIEFGFLELKSHTTVKSCPLPKSSIPLVAQNSQYHSLTTPIDDNIHFTRRGGIDVDGDNIVLNMDRHARQLAEFREVLRFATMAVILVTLSPEASWYGSKSATIFNGAQ